MTINTGDGFIAAQKQNVSHNYFAGQTARTTVAAAWSSLMGMTGQPGVGTLAVGNTANGIVPDDTLAGYPILRAFPGGADGYLSAIQFSNTVASRLALYDCLFSAGAYAFNANTTLAAQPSYAARVPDADYSNGIELWLEQVTAGTGVQNVAVTYTNQAGTAGRTTGTIATAANILGRMWRLPLQAGDSGIQSIQQVVGSVATAGTFNIHVMRYLWSGRVQAANGGDTHDMSIIGMPKVFATSALKMIVCPDSTAAGFPDCNYTIISG